MIPEPGEVALCCFGHRQGLVDNTRVNLRVVRHLACRILSLIEGEHVDAVGILVVVSFAKISLVILGTVP